MPKRRKNRSVIGKEYLTILRVKFKASDDGAAEDRASELANTVKEEDDVIDVVVSEITQPMSDSEDSDSSREDSDDIEDE